VSGALQLLVDCPQCGVECAVVELVDPQRGASFGQCRLCALETGAGKVTAAGRRFEAAHEVESALGDWANAEGEPLADFVASNFGGRSVAQVADSVMRGERVHTSFDVVAWLFKERTGGMVALGANLEVRGELPLVASGSWDRGGSAPPVTPPPAGAAFSASKAPEPRPDRGVDPRVVTRALIATALADGRVLPAERQVLDQLCDKLGAPRPTEEDWRAWRPLELGWPPDPKATVAAMIKLALADRIPDEGEARVIREFARVWRVPVPDPVLPPVTVPQKLTARWLGLFGR